MTTLSELTRQLDEAATQYRQLEITYDADRKRIRAVMDEVRREIRLLTANLDLERVLTAEVAICIEGPQFIYNAAGDTPKMLEDTINEIANGGRRLRYEYFGCKNYDHWRCQRSDHPYGMGPRHGTTVCRIGYTDRYRDMITDEDQEWSLPDHVRDDILYLLHNFRNVYEATYNVPKP